jgi:hypothetical protein
MAVTLKFARAGKLGLGENSLNTTEKPRAPLRPDVKMLDGETAAP